MSQKLVNLIGSGVLMLGTIIVFAWLWSQSRSLAATQPVPENLKPVEIESIKDEAKQLMAGMENNANIPIPVPLEKMVARNPFAALP